MVPRSLPRLRIAVACNVDWNAMVGGDRARFCGQCCQTVYNVQRLRPREVADLLERHGERMPCLRLFTRPDGTVVTRSCLHWVSAGVRRVRMGLVSVAALAVGFWSNVFFLRAWLHPTPPAAKVTVVPVSLRPVSLPRTRVRPPSPPEHYAVPTPGIPPLLDHHERDLLRELRRGGPIATESALLEALRPFRDELKSRTEDLRFRGRANVLLDVRASGRVRRIDISAPPELPAQLRKMIEGSIKRLRLPRNAEDYMFEFPVIFAGSE
jgi:hypothetical protein